MLFNARARKSAGTKGEAHGGGSGGERRAKGGKREYLSQYSTSFLCCLIFWRILANKNISAKFLSILGDLSKLYWAFLRESPSPVVRWRPVFSRLRLLRLQASIKHKKIEGCEQSIIRLEHTALFRNVRQPRTLVNRKEARTSLMRAG